jgi:hypothetical protein
MLRWLALLLLAASAIAQEPIYRTGARLVTVDVTVRNSQGPVKGLTKDDFTVQDKGKPQTIAVFAMTDSAATAVKGDPLPPGVVSKSGKATGEAPRAATVILFDRLNIPRALDQAAVRTKVLEFLASLQPADRIGFYSLGTGLTMDPRGVAISGSSTSGADLSSVTPTEGALRNMRDRYGVQEASTAPQSGLSGTETMEAIAKVTGGAVYHQTNDVGADVRRVMEDAHSELCSWVLRGGEALDGKLHDVSVKLDKKPELNGASSH